MTLTFDLWPQKLISTSMNPHTSVIKYWVKFTSLVCQIWCLQGFWVIACCDLDLLIPKSNQHCLRTQLHMWPKLGEILFIGLWDMVFTKFSGRADSRTHSLTDGQIRLQRAFGAVFQRWRRNKKSPLDAIFRYQKIMQSSLRTVIFASIICKSGTKASANCFVL